uniref:Uncharacterized protein n=1 Tax=Hyaloperonospora arabidopsidis (strain Emoy2) TaxID=559515 RepID=M4BWI6_HYAAE
MFLRRIKLWSSSFDTSNAARRTESSCKTLYNSSYCKINMMLLLYGPPFAYVIKFTFDRFRCGGQARSYLVRVRYT